jgi:hypothetical protein
VVGLESRRVRLHGTRFRVKDVGTPGTTLPASDGGAHPAHRAGLGTGPAWEPARLSVPPGAGRISPAVPSTQPIIRMD